MARLVLYYSNTGNTQKVARLLADRLGADLAEVTCGAYLRWYGPLVMAWDIFTRHRPTVDVLVPPHAAYELVVVGGPVWDARAAPPILALAGRSFWQGARAAVFVTCRGRDPTHPADRALAEMQAMASSGPVATAVFREDDIRGAALDRQVDAFAETLTGSAAEATVSPPA